MMHEEVTVTSTPADITRLEPNEVFVFGSNLAGRHGKGAARTAAMKFGAIYGKGRGPMGQSYAIATKDDCLCTLSEAEIQAQVTQFLDYAKQHPGTRFLVTEIGCGLAGYEPKDIAPMFRGAPSNVVLPASFIEQLATGELRHEKL